MRRLFRISVVAMVVGSAQASAQDQLPTLPHFGPVIPWVDVGAGVWGFANSNDYAEQDAWLQFDLGAEAGTRGDGFSAGIALWGGIEQNYWTSDQDSEFTLLGTFRGLRNAWIGKDKTYFAVGHQQVFYGENNLHPATGKPSPLITTNRRTALYGPALYEMGIVQPRDRDQALFFETSNSLIDDLTDDFNNFTPNTYYTIGHDLDGTVLSLMTDDEFKAYQFDVDMWTGETLRHHASFANYSDTRDDGAQASDWGAVYNVAYHLSDTLTLSGDVEYIHSGSADTAATERKNNLIIAPAIGYKLGNDDYLALQISRDAFTFLDANNGYAESGDFNETRTTIHYAKGLGEGSYAWAQLNSNKPSWTDSANQWAVAGVTWNF